MFIVLRNSDTIDLTEQGNENEQLRTLYDQYNYSDMLAFNTIEGDLTIIEPVITESSTAALKRKHEADNENEKNHGIVI
jgi:hypothetical protein